MNYDDYKQIDAINWSRLKLMRTSPKHYAAFPQRDSDAFRLGRAFHTLTLEPENWSEEYAVWTGKVRRGKEWDAFQETHADKCILTEAQHIQALELASAVKNDPIAAGLIEQRSYTEQVLRWTDLDTGLDCKGRIDFLSGVLVDLKSTANIEPRRFRNDIARFGYHAQLAFYVDGLTSIDIDAEPPALIAVEKTFPFDVVVYRVQETELTVGRTLYKQLLWRVRECMDSEQWPGIAENREIDLELPEWAMPEVNETVTIGGKEFSL